MTDYLRTVTLGAFTWKNKERITLLFEHIRKQGWGRLFLHFLLLSFCLNFPMTLVMSRLTPFELYSRLYGENFKSTLPEAAQVFFNNSIADGSINGFNLFMIENSYGVNVLLPMLGMVFGLTLIIQAVFYLSAVFFLGISRMNAFKLSFRDRMGLALFSSTLPVLAASLFGLFLPTVHVILFYFAVIFIIFQRNGLYNEQ